MTNINLSIVIVHYNCWEYLKRCIDSIVKQSVTPFELIIVDNASKISIKNKLIQYANLEFEIKLIENSSNLGFSKACNIGAQESTQELILFCNPDIFIPNNGIETLYNEYNYNDINLLGCSLSNDKGKQQKVGGVFPHVLNMIPILGKFFKNKSLNGFIKKENLVYSDWITGAVILVSRSDLNKIGLWDESYFMYMEDVNLGKVANSLNMKTGYTSKTTWIHHHGKSSVSRNIDRVNSKSALIQSKHTYIKKHFSGVSKILAHAFIFLKSFPELFIATIIAPFFKIEELKIKKQVAMNTLKFYFKK